jgi:hypothetical protein
MKGIKDCARKCFQSMVHINNKKKMKGKEKVGDGITIPTISNNDSTELQNRLMNGRQISPEVFQKKAAYQEVTENYTKPKIMVCTPCYCGQVHVKYMESMMRLQLVLMKYNIGLEFYTIPFDSLIPRARNACVTRFMASKESTHLLFVDADIQFDATSVVKMLQENKGCIVGAYPKKALDMGAVKENYTKTSNQMELIQSSVKYAFNFKPQKSHRVERGVVEVLDAPTGFMMIKKSVFRSMMAQYPEFEYINDVQAYQVNQHDRFYDLFPSQVFDGRYLSEDYGFCRLWQRMGGEIFTDLTVKLNHIGQFCYFGDPVMFLKHSNNVQLSSNPTTNGEPSSATKPVVVPELVDDPTTNGEPSSATDSEPVVVPELVDDPTTNGEPPSATDSEPVVVPEPDVDDPNTQEPPATDSEPVVVPEPDVDDSVAHTECV